MSIEDAFRKGMELVRLAGLPVTGKERPVIAAESVFRRRAAPVQHDSRFPTDGPTFAKLVILEAIANA